MKKILFEIILFFVMISICFALPSDEQIRKCANELGVSFELLKQFVIANSAGQGNQKNYSSYQEKSYREVKLTNFKGNFKFRVKNLEYYNGHLRYDYYEPYENAWLDGACNFAKEAANEIIDIKRTNTYFLYGHLDDRNLFLMEHLEKIN